MNVPTTSLPGLLTPQEVSVHTDTRELLAHAKRDARKRGFQDWLICDIDAHHVETVSWKEIVDYIEDPVVRQQAIHFHNERVNAPAYGLNGDLGLRYQSVGGRIPHQDGPREVVTETDVHRDVTLTRRAMEALAIDYMVVFPTPMLFLGMHPQPEMEVWLSRAYNSWMIDRLLSADDRIKSLIYVPFNTPAEAEKVVKDFGDKKGVIGFCVPSTRYKPVHHNDYMRLYAMIQESGKPIAFHAGYHWQDQSLATINRFLGMHALGFVWCNMVHMTNWICNGIPERFPQLKSIWVESGLAWVPFLMQRLDDQYLMRPSEAPLLYDAADGNQQHEGAAGDHGDDQGGDAAAVRIGLAALRLRPAVGDLRSAVPVGAGQAQHPRAERRAHLRARSEAAEDVVGLRVSLLFRPDPFRPRA
jgi:uncharacterized protein